MTFALKKKIERAVEISKNPTLEGIDELRSMMDENDARASTVGAITILTIGDDETVDFEKFTLLLNPEDLN